MNADQWFEIAKIALSSATAIGIAWIGFLTAKSNRNQVVTAVKVEEAASKVEVVRQVLEDSTSKTDIKLSEIHKQVNGNMSVQMKLVALTSRRLANMSGDAEDIKAAEMAEQALKDHEQIQVQS